MFQFISYYSVDSYKKPVKNISIIKKYHSLKSKKIPFTKKYGIIRAIEQYDKYFKCFEGMD
jgi:hypothetical protein